MKVSRIVKFILVALVLSVPLMVQAQNDDPTPDGNPYHTPDIIPGEGGGGGGATHNICNLVFIPAHWEDITELRTIWQIVLGVGLVEREVEVVIDRIYIWGHWECS